MSLTDQISIVNGEEPERRYTATFTAEERTYITKAILKMPQHLHATSEIHIMHEIIAKLGYPEVPEREKERRKKQHEGWTGTGRDRREM